MKRLISRKEVICDRGSFFRHLEVAWAERTRPELAGSSCAYCYCACGSDARRTSHVVAGVHNGTHFRKFFRRMLEIIVAVRRRNSFADNEPARAERMLPAHCVTSGTALYGCPLLRSFRRLPRIYPGTVISGGSGNPSRLIYSS